MSLSDTLLLTARRLTRSADRGRWRVPALRTALTKNSHGGTVPELRPDRGPLSRLIEAGELQVWPAGRWTEYQAVLPMNLREIVDRARERVSHTKQAKPGSNSGHDPNDRRHHYLTPSQFKDGRSGARLIGSRYDGSNPEKGMEHVEHDRFVWDRNAGRGTLGDWRILGLLERIADETGKAKGTTQKYKSGLKALLDLAATREWISRTEVHNPDWKPLPPAWTDVYEKWRAVLLDDGHPGARGTVLELLRAVSRSGAEAPQRAAWDDVITYLEAHWEAFDTSASQRTKVRAGYRELRDREIIEGPEWAPYKQRIERSLPIVSASDCAEVGRLYGRDGHRIGVQAALRDEHEPWPERWNEHEALVEGPYGLRWWVLHRTTDPDEQHRLGLPERTDKPLRPATIQNKLAIVARVAGFVSDRFGVEWATQDLRALFRREHLEAWHAYQKEETDGGLRTRKMYVTDLGVMAGKSLLPLAEEREDGDLVRRFQRAHALLAGNGLEGRSSYADRLKVKIRDDASGLGSMRAASRRIERAWTRNSTVALFAYDQMRAVGRQALQLLVNDYGTLESQRQTLDSGRNETSDGRIGTLDRTWAKRVRDVLLWWDQLVVPYRTQAIVEMDFQDRRSAADFTHLTGRVHSWKRKKPNSEWHEPNYRKADGSPYPSDLYRLYVTEAREQLLTRKDGSRWEPDPDNRYHHRKPDEDGKLREPFYTNRLTESKYARMSKRAVADAIKRVVETVLERRPEALGGVTHTELASADRVLIPHAFRHALAKKMLVAPEATQDERRGRRLDAVCLILDHSDPTMIWSVYAGTDESDYDIGVMAGSA